MKSYKCLFLLLLLAGLAQFVYAQDPELFLKNYNINNSSISNNTITSIVQDENDFIWLGSENGLMRYDGYNFKNYTLDSNFILGLTNDKNGKLVVQTESNIQYYNSALDSFEKVKFSEGLFGGYHAYIDDDNVIWAEDYEELLYFKNDQLITFTPSSDISHAPKNIYLYQYYLSRNIKPNKVNKSSNNKLFKFLYKTIYNYCVANYGEDVLTDLDAQYSENFNIDVDNQNNYYFLLYDIIIKINVDSSKLKIIDFKNPKNNKKLAISRFVIDNNDNLWAYTPIGLYQIKNDTQERYYFTNKPGGLHSLSQHRPTKLYIDSQDNMWIGYDQGGVSLTNISLLHKYAYYDPYINYEAGYKNDPIKRVCESNNNLLIIASGKGVLFYDKLLKTYVYPISKNSRIYNERTENIFVDNQNRLYATLDKVYVYDLNTKKHVNTFDFTCNSICQTKNEDICFLTPNRGIIIFDENLKKRRSITNIPYKDATEESEKGILYKDSESDGMWMPANDLFYIENSSGSVFKIIIDDLLKERTHVNDISRINNSLWLATDRGLIQLKYNTNPTEAIKKSGNEKQVSVKRFGDKNSLLRKEILSIIRDKDNNLWMTFANDKIIKFNPETEIFNDVTFGDNINNFNFAIAGAYKNKKGELFFWSSDGIITFNPQDISISNNHRKTKIVDLKVLNQPIKVGEEYNGNIILAKEISQTNSLTLSHRDKSITLEFATTGVSAPQNEVYAYRLEGFDQDWKYTNAKHRIVTYTNLDAGIYTFNVKSSLNNKEWSDAAILNIEVTPPFWLTIYAKIVYAILFVLISYAIYRYATVKANYTNKIEKAELENNYIQKVNKLRINYFSTISHELRTPLTLILGPLEDMMPKIKSDFPFINQLKTMQRNANSLLRLINQLLEFKKIDENHLKLEVSKNDIVNYIKEIFNAFSNYADQKNINYQFKSSTDSFQTFFDADKLEKILSNLLLNAFNYTPSGGNITLKITLTDSNIEIEISDSGVGISKERINHIFDRFYTSKDSYNNLSSGIGIGLALTKKLVELHHGKISVLSNISTLETPNSGTQFTVFLPINKTYDASKIIETKTLKYVPSPPFIIDSSSDSSANILVNQEELSKDSPRILIVEDNIDITNYLKDILQNQYYLEFAENGKEGLSKANELDIDLIISDIMMPEMEGTELCKIIKTNINTSHIPVILLTAKKSSNSEIEALGLGADDYITKPFNKNILLARVSSIIDNRKKLRELFLSQKEFAPAKVTKNPIDIAFLDKAKEVIELNIDVPGFSMDTFAKELAVSKPNMFKKMKKLTGLTPNSFITRIKLEKASKLLKNTNYSISEIAYKLGYNDPNYFSKLFKSQFNISPTSYRE